MSHFDWWDKRNRQGTQPSLSPAHKPQAQPSQASTGQARPGHSRAQPSPSGGVGLAKAVPKAFSYRIQIKPSLAQPRPAQPTTQARSAQPKPSSQTASPVQPDQHRSGQARPQPSPAQPSPSRGVGLAKALPKAFSYRIQRCHSRPALRFCSVFGRFGAAVPLRFAVLERWFLDLFLVLSQACLLFLSPWSLAKARPSPAQTSSAAAFGSQPSPRPTDQRLSQPTQASQPSSLVRA